MEEKENVLFLPSDVVHTSGDKTYVYTLSEEGVRNICYVVTGIRDRENIEIVEYDKDDSFEKVLEAGGEDLITSPEVFEIEIIDSKNIGLMN